MQFMYKDSDGIEYRLIPFSKDIFTSNTKHKTMYKIWLTDPEVTRYNSHGLFKKSDADIENWFKDIDSGKIICWALFKVNGGAMSWLGVVSLQSINWIYRSCEIALYIGATSYWGKGLAKFMVESACSHAFKKMNMNRVWSGTAARNIGMNKVFERTGFKREGIFREGMFIDGTYCDINLYSLLKSDVDKLNFDERDAQ